MNVVLNGGEWQGIAWVFVRNFAWNMLLMARLGFVGIGEMMSMRPFNLSLPRLALEVRLRVL